MTGPRLYKNRIWLEERCELYTAREIADQCGCSPPTIVIWIKKFGIIRREHRPKPKSPKTGLKLGIPNYMMLHLKRHAEKTDESVDWVVKRAITEFFFRLGINVFREHGGE